MVGVRALIVDGDSMSPTIRRGETVLVEDRAPRRGEVALIERPDGLLVHRILDSVGPWVVHAGDASAAAGIAGIGEVAGRIPLPARRDVPALRHARLLGMFLRAAAVLHRIGIRPAGPLRAAAARLKNLLRWPAP
ncbi:MAG: S24/S26 family peptidase [Planctomycetes bacterium]|nr:S24/S26 family peptidase [Planctomycetota bacterium]